MKKIFIIMKNILVLFILLLTNSCENILETVPNDRISSSIYWKTDVDAEYAANAIYNYLDGIRIFQYDALTDILHTNIQFADLAQMERGEYDAHMEFIQSVWSESYKGIRAANAFLENVGKIETLNQGKLNVLSAEVRTIRAYLYAQLVMLYGDVPLVTNSIDNIPEGNTLSRTSVQKVWNFVNKEYAECATILPKEADVKGRITKGAALALYARALLYQGNWQQAADVAKSVMDLDCYKLYDSYEKLFSYEAENNVEVILDKQSMKDVNSNNVFALLAPFSIKKQGPDFVPTKKIFDAYRMQNGKLITDPESGFSNQTQYDNRDPRLKYSIFLPCDTLPDGHIYEPTPGSGSQDEIGNTYLATSLGYNIKKYINPEDILNTYNCGINIILLRYAEVLLTYAEAKVELNQLDDAIVAINEVRQRKDVNMPPVQIGLNQNQMRDVVRNERMVELAFEGFRLFDCRRWKNAELLFPGKVEGLVYKENGKWKTIEIGGFIKIFNPEKHYLWPIPQKEIDLNKNLVQNPNW